MRDGDAIVNMEWSFGMLLDWGHQCTVIFSLYFIVCHTSEVSLCGWYYFYVRRFSTKGDNFNDPGMFRHKFRVF